MQQTNPLLGCISTIEDIWKTANKSCFHLFLITIISIKTNAQHSPTMSDTASAYFSEIITAAEANKNVWGVNLYGPILILNPFTRQVYANFSDTLGVLKKEGDIFRGRLPANVPVGNLSVEWGGRRWAMILTLFISEDFKSRVDLFAHELFHRAQPELGFTKLSDLPNNHLDTREGRIYLRLELEALKKALSATKRKERDFHIANALGFRQYRYKLFPDAYKSEATIEINEGVASYTGKVFRGLKKNKVTPFMLYSIDSFFRQKNYVQLFAYETVPAYGFLLRDKDLYWNKKLNRETNLSDFFSTIFQKENRISIPANSAIDTLAVLYNGVAIRNFEVERENTIATTIAAYKKKFLEQPCLEIKFTGRKNISYDTRYIVTIEGIGRVNPTMTIIADFGVLDIKNVGGLLTNDDRLLITIPLKTEGNTVLGDGWTLTLKERYEIVKNDKTGGFSLVKKY